MLNKTRKTTVHPKSLVRERKTLKLPVVDIGTMIITLTSLRQETVAEAIRRPQLDPLIMTIGAGGTIVATTIDMEEVAEIMAIEPVTKARVEAEAEAAIEPAPKL